MDEKGDLDQEERDQTSKTRPTPELELNPNGDHQTLGGGGGGRGGAGGGNSNSTTTTAPAATRDENDEGGDDEGDDINNISVRPPEERKGDAAHGAGSQDASEGTSAGCAPPRTFEIGERVVLQNLSTDGHLNGLTAIVRRFEGGKAFIMIQADGRLVSCKARHIRSVDDSSKKPKPQRESDGKGDTAAPSAEPIDEGGNLSQQVASHAGRFFAGAKLFGASLLEKINKETRALGEWQLGLYRVSSRIICVRYPSEEGYALKPIDTIARWANKSFQSYMVYNLSQHTYDYTKFKNQVVEMACPGFSGVLTVSKLFSFVKSVHSWLLLDETNVAVVHCQEDGGTSAVALSCYLFWSRAFSDLSHAFKYVGQCKGDDIQSLASPMQLRFARYFEQIITQGSQVVSRQPIKLMRVLVHTIPSFTPNRSCKPYIQVLVDGKAVYTGAEMGSKVVKEATQDQGTICFPVEKELGSDFVVQVCHCLNKRQAVCMFKIGLDVGFLREGLRRLDKSDVDISGRHEHRIDEDFYVDLVLRTANTTESTGHSHSKCGRLSQINDNRCSVSVPKKGPGSRTPGSGVEVVETNSSEENVLMLESTSMDGTVKAQLLTDGKLLFVDTKDGQVLHEEDVSAIGRCSSIAFRSQTYNLLLHTRTDDMFSYDLHKKSLNRIEQNGAGIEVQHTTNEKKHPSVGSSGETAMPPATTRQLHWVDTVSLAPKKEIRDEYRELTEEVSDVKDDTPSDVQSVPTSSAGRLLADFRKGIAPFTGVGGDTKRKSLEAGEALPPQSARHNTMNLLMDEFDLNDDTGTNAEDLNIEGLDDDIDDDDLLRQLKAELEESTI